MIRRFALRPADLGVEFAEVRDGLDLPLWDMSCPAAPRGLVGHRRAHVIARLETRLTP